MRPRQYLATKAEIRRGRHGDNTSNTDNTNREATNQMNLRTIEDALRKGWPGREESKYPVMAYRVWCHLLNTPPIDEVDRLFLGGSEGERSDEQIAIDRYFLTKANSYHPENP